MSLSRDPQGSARHGNDVEQERSPAGRG